MNDVHHNNSSQLLFIKTTFKKFIYRVEIISC